MWRIRALPLGALEDDRGVVLALDGLREAAVADRLGPAGEDVDVAGVVHQVDRARPRRPGADLAEDGLAVGGAEPLHVGEAGAEAERLEHRVAHLDAGGHAAARRRRAG